RIRGSPSRRRISRPARREVGATECDLHTSIQGRRQTGRAGNGSHFATSCSEAGFGEIAATIQRCGPRKESKALIGAAVLRNVHAFGKQRFLRAVRRTPCRGGRGPRIARGS